MTSLDRDPLDELASGARWEPHWQDVLARAQSVQAGRRGARMRLPRRRLALALAVVSVVAVPFVTYAAANEWWFLRAGPKTATAPEVVKEGVWSGHPWQLSAYRSTTDGLCFAVTPQNSPASGEGATMSCSPIVGVPRTRATKQTPDATITYLSGSAGELPTYIAGPVVATAAEVVIRLEDAHVLRTTTFAGPRSLGQVRFYALPMPGAFRFRPQQAFVVSVAGIDEGGKVVACLVPHTAVDGLSPLSACQP